MAIQSIHRKKKSEAVVTSLTQKIMHSAARTEQFRQLSILHCSTRLHALGTSKRQVKNILAKYIPIDAMYLHRDTS